MAFTEVFPCTLNELDILVFPVTFRSFTVSLDIDVPLGIVCNDPEIEVITEGKDGLIVPYLISIRDIKDVDDEHEIYNALLL